MKLFDVNILGAAFREDAPSHVPIKELLESAINGTAPFGMSRTVLSGFLRIVTHPRVFMPASPLADAFAFCDNIRQRRGFHWIEPGPSHWDIFARLCRQTNARGNLIPDAWLAALAIESGSTWISADSDYGLFEGLEKILISV